LVFEDLESQVKGNLPTYSNGSVYADFDNDGDLDILVNNIDDPVLIYANTSNDKIKKAFASISLQGPENNINAIGAKFVLFSKGAIRTYEKSPVRGFLSSMEIPLHIGLENVIVDSAFLVWPDNSCQNIQFNSKDGQYKFQFQKGLKPFNYQSILGFQVNANKSLEDISASAGLLFKHNENIFNEFNREPLIPHMLSTEGPALAVGDANSDGLEDVFLGASKGFKPSLMLQQSNGKFIKQLVPAFDADSLYEDVDAIWADLNNDGHQDLVVASGGNEYYGQEEWLKPRVYLSNGKAGFTKQADAFSNIYTTQGAIAANDFNGDGLVDLFIGGRSVPFAYGAMPSSYLLLGDGKGHFKDVTESKAKGLSQIGMVTQALWYDIDQDQDQDLLICSEWGGITAFLNNKGQFSQKLLSDKRGWWNCLLPVDIDNDGDIDLIAGNLGLNSRLKASKDKPVRMFYQDFDDNGKKEQVLTYFLGDKELPFANKAELEKQMPIIKKKFLYAEDFAKASLKDIFTASKLDNAIQYSADWFSNTLFLNNGKLDFNAMALPNEAQWSSVKAITAIDANGDDLLDILLLGNYYDNNIQMGRYDADFGTLLINKGKGVLEASPLNELVIKGQVRRVSHIRYQEQNAWVLAKNNDSVQLIRFKNQTKK
ncbi:MAG TPA: FG-GAP-like repeat-containing protein, partial [Sediminibacterium sp.]|nr:FG-GAP-like repeat-containing protein [Sediminibacterium sp.]